MELIFELYSAWVIMDLMGVFEKMQNNNIPMKKARKALRKDYLIRAYRDRTEKAKEMPRACAFLSTFFC